MLPAFGPAKLSFFVSFVLSFVYFVYFVSCRFEWHVPCFVLCQLDTVV